MSKELEEIREIITDLKKERKASEEQLYRLGYDYGVIEKSLKALEIIKGKGVITVYLDFYGGHLVVNNMVIDITQEEYDLLKEVLL